MKFQVELWGGADPIVIEVEGEVIATLDGKELAQEMLDSAIRFGFRQLIRDAGAISAADAAKPDADTVRSGLARKKAQALVDGTYREGAGGGKPLSPVDREVRAIAERNIRASFDDPENKAWVAEKMQETGLDKAQLLQAAVKAHVEDDHEELIEEAKANLAKAPKVSLRIAPPKPKAA